MKKIAKNSGDFRQTKLIEKALRTGGFLFPQTVEEVMEFERIYGKTDVILPEELHDLTFLEKSSERPKGIKPVEFVNENFAMVAREGIDDMPEEIRHKILRDIQNSRKKDKRKK